MNCPDCGKPGVTGEIQWCRSCRKRYATKDLLELHQLDFLLEETAGWQGTEALRVPYVERLEKLRARLAPRQPGKTAVLTPESAPAAAGEVTATAAEPAAARPTAARPHAPPSEKVPFDQWLLSERNIKIALYSGAAMLVAAGLIFVGVSWARMSGPSKLAITLTTTGLMYLAGYLLFRQPSLRIGGIALLGVASGFVTVDFAILQLYLLGPAGLRDDVMWLIGSTLCLALYLLTAYWTRGDLFAYLGLAALVSMVTAALVVGDAPLLALLPAYALLAYGSLWLARAVRHSQVAEYAGIPLLVTAQAGTALVVMVAFVLWVSETGCKPCNLGSPWLAILALGIGAVFYVTTDLVFRGLAERWTGRVFGLADTVVSRLRAALWAAAPLLILTLALALVELDAGQTMSAVILMLSALAYLGVGHMLRRWEGRPASTWPFCATAYATALLVTALAMPDAGDLYKVLIGDVLLLAVSAAIFRNYWWIYAASWLFILPAYLILYLYIPSLVHRGLFVGLLGLGYSLAGYALGRRSLFLGGPLLSAATLLSIMTVGLTWGDPVLASLILAVIALLYLGAALWLRWNWLLLAPLLALHLVIFSLSNMLLTSTRALVWVLAVCYGVLGLALLLGGLVLRRLGQARWVWPLYMICALDLAGAYLAGLVLGGPLAVGVSVMIAGVLFGLAWLERAELAERGLTSAPAYAGVAASFVGHFYVLNLAGLTLDDLWPAFSAGLCAAFVGLAWLLRREPLAKLFGAPLRWAGLVLMTIPLLGSGWLLLLDDRAVLLAFTFAIASLTYSAEGALRRVVGLLYLGIAALVVVVWGLLIAVAVTEPQAYVLPAGLALLGIGWNERRLGRNLAYQGCLMPGLVLLMGSAFVQSLGRGNWPYALLLMVESLVVIGWGVRWRLKRCIQVGGLALVANAVGQVGPAFVELSGWIQIGLTGAVLLGGGMAALLKREEILAARQRLAEGWRQWAP